MSASNSWGIDAALQAKRNLERQKRIETMPTLPFATATQQFTAMRSYLVACAQQGVITTAQDEIFKSLRFDTASSTVWMCTPKNFKRDSACPRITRLDGAWLDLSVSFATNASRELILAGYDAEIWFPTHDNQHSAPAWIRLDFNLEAHTNDYERAMRSHLHPGTDDWFVPSPLLSPIELLDLLVFGCKIPAGRAPRG
ncbi:MAG: hypothetical protein Q8Q09_10390 [Deltaproteobacteria bacterium]|nr:hypothetical protein [Deltaproteobacteria bacterium]